MYEGLPRLHPTFPASCQAGAPNPLGSHITFDVFAKAFKPNGYTLLARGVPSAQNYMNHSRPSSADNKRIGGAETFAERQAAEATSPIEARSTPSPNPKTLTPSPALTLT